MIRVQRWFSSNTALSVTTTFRQSLANSRPTRLIINPNSQRGFASSSTEFPVLSNALDNSQSPYLRAQAQSPVAWQEWTPSVLELATSFNKPIFLSIGFQSSYWCRVMEHESFNDPNIAKFINKNFIPIRVDRDERRDIDLLYTMYYEVITGRSGWPLNFFLEPTTLAPFYGGNYWPSAATVAATPSSTQQQNTRPGSFEDILRTVTDTWAGSHERCVQSAKVHKDSVTELYRLQNGSEKADLKLSVFEDVWAYFRDNFDIQYGGFSQSPKFPCPHNLTFLLKYSDLITQDPTSDTRPSYQKTHELSAKEMASFTLQKMGGGALKDQVGNGFHHYSVTDDWSLPKFEKLLIDQSLLLNAYVYAYQADPVQNKFALNYIKDIVTYMSRDVADGGLKSKLGGLILAEDADSKPSEAAVKKENENPADLEYVPYEKVEGAYYVWQYEEFGKALDKMERDIAEAYYNVRELGNINEDFDVYHKLAYQNTLFRNMTVKELSQYFGMPEKKIGEYISSANEKLRKYRRSTRDHPLKDSRIFAGYNGAAITGLANAAIALGATAPNPRDPELAAVGNLALQNAEEIANFVYNNMYDQSGKLNRYYITGEGQGPSKTLGMNDDYAYMIQGLIALYTATFNTFYLDFAKQLQDAQLVKFWDTENGAFYYSDSASAEQSKLSLRFKQSFDSAEPSSNGVSCENLFKISGLLHDSFYRDKAIEILECYGKDIEAQPFGYCSMLGSVAAYLRRNSRGSLTSVLVVGGEGSEYSSVETKNGLEKATNQEIIQEQLFQVRQHLFNSFAEGSLISKVDLFVSRKDDNPTTKEQEQEIRTVEFPSLRVPNIMPNLTLLRLTQRDIEEYYEPYGNAFYGALVDKYSKGPVKYIVTRNFEAAEPIDSLEELLEAVFNHKGK